MSPRTGRPTKNPRNINITLRISKHESEILEYCAKKIGINRVDVIVKGIQMVKSDLDKKE